MSKLPIELSLNMAMTIDGKTVRPDGRWYGLTSKKDKEMMIHYRSQVDYVIMGLASIEIDNNDLLVPTISQLQNQPTPVIVSRSKVPSSELIIFNKNYFARPLVFLNIEIFPNALHDSKKTDCKNSDALKKLKKYAEVVLLKPNQLEPREILNEISRRGGQKVLLEGGPTQNFSYFNKDLIDILNITIVPFVIGMDTLPSICKGASALPDFSGKKWILFNSQNYGNEIFMTYKRSKL